ncbi:hypothetical protein OG746_26930 [Streptomyces sp. NBC_01016]|uniref:hypothetical protein n=1 Tax=Streptomyces sp. NBC_01016 TaxID=2903720 RepID=UPI00224DC4E7|nr:hypothetical protein [Streptomyces sp. NBC_01016]MCX4827134.1 hypothetical protein [Streptomyces sp. NBC_01016]MCX4832377.1 hypothetical protein [Streptomyces sp. NBC_01016]
MTTTAQAGASAPAAGRSRKAKAPAPTGADRIPQPSQGWYRDKVTGDKLRRVTTILEKGCSKGDALTFWAGNITADTAMDHLPYLVSSSLQPAERTEARNWLARAHVRKKDERKDVGSAVHKLIEAHVLGTPMPAELLGDPNLTPFLDHFLTFVEDWQVTFEASEMVVGNREQGYAGTLDYLLRSPLVAAALAAYFNTDVPADSVFCGDTKTGGELDVKGVYPEASLQMAAYRKAKVAWLRDGSTVPMPDTFWSGVVLHLRPEGYRLIPAVADDDVFQAFLTVKANSEWTSGLSKTVIRPALTLPTITEERAA